MEIHEANIGFIFYGRPYTFLMKTSIFVSIIHAWAEEKSEDIQVDDPRLRMKKNRKKRK